MVEVLHPYSAAVLTVVLIVPVSVVFEVFAVVVVLAVAVVFLSTNHY